MFADGNVVCFYDAEHRPTRGSAGQLALTVVERIMEGLLTASRQTEKTVDTRH